MRLWPRSLYARLLGLALLTTAAALVFSGLAIGHVMERFVRSGLDEQLDAQVAILVSAVRPDGTLDRSRLVELPAFARHRGWSWRVSGARGAVGNGVPLAPLPPATARSDDDDDPPSRTQTRGHRREREEHDPGLGSMERRVVRTTAGPVTIVAMSPRRHAYATLREALLPLLVSLGLLGIVLTVAALVQLRLGLAPLRALQGSLRDVRDGRRRHVPGEQPSEIAPLADELNALIDQNEAGLAHARRHVANLAHGIKTPLAALAVRLAESGRDPDGALTAMVTQIDARVRHHLGRARAATPAGASRARTPIAPALTDLILVMGRVHADRPIRHELAAPPDLAAAIDPQDADELLGNLLDNAWRHARSLVRVAAAETDGAVVVAIEDDGAGLDDAVIHAATEAGVRLDEGGEGFGFGLAISRELTELNGGTLSLDRAPELGGLRVRVRLPRAAERTSAAAATPA